MKSKDPAFLFYPLNWLEGTAEMLPAEKGVFIDLLCHQHQKGSLPTETSRLCRLVGMNEYDFIIIWNHIKDKFSEVDNRLVNRKLCQVSTDRASRAKKNKITGIFATLVRKSLYEDYVDNQLVNKIKKMFKVDEFLDIEDIKLMECITKWYNQMVVQMVEGKITIPFASLENKDKDENEGEDINTINIVFDDFWNLYDKKVGHKNRCEKKWNKLTDGEREKIMNILPEWKKKFVYDNQYQPYPETYLNGKRWEDEIYKLNGHEKNITPGAESKNNEKIENIDYQKDNE